jgi:hypothetical protein
MDYISLFLSLLLPYGSFRFWSAGKGFGTHKLNMFAVSFLCYGAGSLAWILPLLDTGANTEFYINSILDWFQVAGVSFALCGLAIENWEDRPPVARYPYVLSFTPLLLILTFAFVFQTVFLKEIILAIYEGVGLLIAVLLFVLLFLKNAEFIYTLIGVVLLVLAYVVYWFPADLISASPWIWKLIASVGLLVLIHGYLLAAIPVLETRKKEEES